VKSGHASDVYSLMTSKREIKILDIQDLTELRVRPLDFEEGFDVSIQRGVECRVSISVPHCGRIECEDLQSASGITMRGDPMTLKPMNRLPTPGHHTPLGRT